MLAEVGTRALLDEDGLAAVLSALVADGFALVGPTVREGAIVLDTLHGIGDLPRGVGDEQAPGHYRLRRRRDDAFFGFATSPHAFKRFLLPPRVPIARTRRTPGGFVVEPPGPLPPRLALIGVRPCEITAIAVQDRVLRDGRFPDPDYAARREGLFVLAVHCVEPAGTCFCASMGTGPRATTGFDLAATELIDPAHAFLVEVGTEAGAAVLRDVAGREATPEERRRADDLVADAAGRMGRALDTADLPALLLDHLEHPAWRRVADRCLGCGNCTLSCPTCFCTTVEDTTDLTGDAATRTRRWDSCFALDFSYVHGGALRPSLQARYRQWLTHKLATWHEQFGTSGCVGCGRCITWCPVGIDITEEVAEIRDAAGREGWKTSNAS